MTKTKALYSVPSTEMILLHVETAFLGSNDNPGGNIPQLVEGEVPDDLWG